jgi:hypothetical protein
VTLEYYELTTIDVTLPENAILLAGGFEIHPLDPTDENWSAAYLDSAGLISSMPIEDSEGNAVGWRLEQQYSLHILGQHVTRPVTTAYALYASKNLVPAGTVDSSLTEDLGYAMLSTVAECGRTGFSTGGGFEFAGDPLIPHQHFISHALDEFDGWTTTGEFGWEAPGGGSLIVCAVCNEIPVVTVNILYPLGILGELVWKVDPANPSQSFPVTLTAHATDSSGTPLTGAQVHWIVDGEPTSTGESFSAPLPAPQSSEDSQTYEVAVVATDSEGNQGTDVVYVTIVR